MRQITITKAHAQFLELERRRLREEYDLNVTLSELVQALIESHRMKVTQVATEDPDSVPWFYRYLAENKDGRV